MNRARSLLTGVLLTSSALVVAAGPGTKTSKSAAPYLETPRGAKPRVVITADPELDDNNSLLRYLLYSSDFQTEGLIYASSGVHWAGDGKGTLFSVPGREYFRFGLKLCPCSSYRWKPGEAFIEEGVAAYAKAYPNLKLHHPGYPTPEMLQSKIRVGNIKFDGEMKEDTPGSDLIKSLLLDDISSPVYLHAWGGQSTIARALKSIEERYSDTPQWPEIRAKVIAKAVIHPSGDQDDTYARYIAPNWPEIRYRPWEGGVPLGYGAQDMVSTDDLRFYSADWFQKNIVSKGPMGARQRSWGDGKPMIEGDRFEYFHLAGFSPKQLKQKGYILWLRPQPEGEFLGEGDTHTFLNLIDNGLRGYRGDSLGGWGGYPAKGDHSAAGSSVNEWLKSLERQVTEADYMMPPLPRGTTDPFIASSMLDLAARYAWATTPTYKAANHNPRVTIAGPADVSGRPGQKIRLTARTSDPDGNKVALRWRIWQEAGTYAGRHATVSASKPGSALMVVPADAKAGDKIVILAEATDDGTPTLSAYGRISLQVR